MEISDLIKSARIEKGLTEQQLPDVVFLRDRCNLEQFKRNYGSKCPFVHSHIENEEIYGLQGNGKAIIVEKN